MTAKQRLRLATVPLPLLSPQAPGQLSLTGEPVPGEGGIMYANCDDSPEVLADYADALRLVLADRRSEKAQEAHKAVE